VASELSRFCKMARRSKVVGPPCLKLLIPCRSGKPTHHAAHASVVCCSRYKGLLKYFTACLLFRYKVYHHLQNFAECLTLLIRQSIFSCQPCLVIPFTRRSVFHWWLDTKYLWGRLLNSLVADRKFGLVVAQ